MGENSGGDYPAGVNLEALTAAVKVARARAGVAIIVGVFFLAWAWRDGISIYGKLPDRVPTHFGPGGAPDGWAAKSVFSVYGLLIMGAVTLVAMAVVSRMGARWYNFPGKEEVLKLPPVLQIYVISPLQETIAWLGASIAVTFSVGVRQMWAVGLGERPAIVGWIMFLPAVVGLGGMVVAILAARARLRAVGDSRQRLQ